ncbi:MAG: hypothetical protein AABX85_01770 [Nanoarchaeota archaeon]
MKKSKKVILITIIILLDLLIIYFAFEIGKNIAERKIINSNEAKCLFDYSPDNNIIISKEQAICLINNNEVVKFHGIGSPFYYPDVIRLEMKSGKIIVVNGNVSELTSEFTMLGAHAPSK